MPRFLFLLASLLVAAPALAAGADRSEDRTSRAEYGEALYYAEQGKWFDALVRLDAPRARSRGAGEAKTAPIVTGHARTAGGFELGYRMHRRAETALKAVIEGAVRDDQRNEALFRLARMYYQNDRPEEARHAVGRIRGTVPVVIGADLALLRANIALALGRTAEAVAVLKELQSGKNPEGFGSYNLGIALLRAGDEQQGREHLDRTGRIRSDDRAVLAIRDKANLVLGERLLSEGRFDAAKGVLDRVRLSGPFSNRALLSSGWSDASQARYEHALVPWSILAGREIADPAVQEAMLAVPYAYGRLGAYSTAALKYEAALKAFGAEISRIDAAIAGIRQGSFLKSLVQADQPRDAAWVANLRGLPEAPEFFYLPDLMAAREFQEALKNYLDLEELRERLDAWSGDLDAFEDIIRRRAAYYEPLLPAIDREFALIDARIKGISEQRDRIAQQLEAMHAAPRPDLLVTADEHAMSEQVARLEKLVTPQNRKTAPRLSERIRRLRGVLSWKRYAEYDRRLADTRRHLRELDQELDVLKRQQKAFARTRLTAIESYQGYGDVISLQRRRIEAARETVQALIVRHRQVIEAMAVSELTRRRDRLEAFRVKARFALADSYDRAGEARIREKDAP